MYCSNSNSTEALDQLLLQIPRKNNTNLTGRSKDYNNSDLSSALFHLLIRNPCKHIFISVQMQKNITTLNWYAIKIIEYGIQAYGEEAKELYKEINGFIAPTAVTTTTSSRDVHKEKLLENDNKYQEQDGEQEKLKLVKEAINCITGCCFDNGCILMFKKLRNVCVPKRKITFS
jgi:hypothetical protein